MKLKMSFLKVDLNNQARSQKISLHAINLLFQFWRIRLLALLTEKLVEYYRNWEQYSYYLAD